jgi:NDP-sugar pyrophosphorylase family protein
MIDLEPSECTAAIFCGGENLRLGRLSGIQAKTLLAAYDTPLIWRLIDQLRSAGFSTITVSTTPRFELEITEAISCYLRSTPNDQRIQVVASVAQEHGVLFGLRDVLDMGSARNFLFCLGDIFFLSNPFLSIRPHITSEYDCLGVAPLIVEEEVGLGGLVYQDQGRIHNVVERPGKICKGSPMRWSGTALVERSRALTDIDAFLLDSEADSPAGEFFEFQCARGNHLECVTGPDFVNVNSPDHLLLASLYAKLESVGSDEHLWANLAEAARSLRLDLANWLQPVRHSSNS